MSTSTTDQEQQPPPQQQQQAGNNTSPSKGLKRQRSHENLEAVGSGPKEPKRDASPLKNGSSGDNNTNKNNDETNSSNAKMTPKKPSASEQHHDENVLEKGTVIFSYKPILGVDEASSLAEVQVFHIILEPDNSEQQQQDGGKKEAESAPKTRLIKIGKKKLPDTDAKERFWAHVVDTEKDLEAMEGQLESHKYDTSTVGTRTVKSDRIAGKGKYIIAKVDGRRTNIGFVLESPAELGPVQTTFNIGKEGSYSLAVKNPSKDNPPQAGLGKSEKAEFPQELKAKFGDLRWIPVEPALLDFVGCELLFIGSSDHLADDFGHDTAMEVAATGTSSEGNGGEKKTTTTGEGGSGSSEEKAREVMKEIHLDPEAHPIQPLVDGQWPKPEDAPEKQKKDGGEDVDKAEAKAKQDNQ